MEKVVNLEYGLLESQKRLSRNGNLEFSLEKTLGPPWTPPPGVCVRCVWDVCGVCLSEGWSEVKG